MFAVVFTGAIIAFGPTSRVEAQFGGGSVASEQQLFPNGLPRMETMLKAALAHHPEVLAARSKLRAAEAEQRQAELKALREVMAVRDRWEKASQMVAWIKSAPEGKASELRDALADQSAAEWELTFLLGTPGEIPTGTVPAGDAGPHEPNVLGASAVAPVKIDTVIPVGERAEMIHQKLQQPVTINFENLSVTDVVARLSESSQLRFVIDKAAFDDYGISLDDPITCNLGEVELVTALQALQDLVKPLYFVVRDYGILVTTEEKRSSQTVSAHDFEKLSEEELRDKLQQQRQEEANGANNGGGAGGGFF